MKAFIVKWATKLFMYLWYEVVLDMIRDYVNGKLDPTGQKDNSVVLQGKIDRDGGVNLPAGDFKVDHTVRIDDKVKNIEYINGHWTSFQGIILQSPSGDKWRFYVDDYGQLIGKLITEEK